MRNHKKTALAVLGLSAALLGSPALAVTLTGTTVSYSFDNAELGLFGTASVSGDELVFTPSNFEAVSANGVAGFAAWTVHVTVNANSGYQLSSFNLAEGGSYSQSGIAGVGVTGEFGALDIEGATNNTYLPATIQATAAFDGTSPNWTAQAGVTLPATGWGGTDDLVGSVSLTISNQLYAYTGIGGAASIAKEFVNLSAMTTAITTPVPEAQTYAMMLAGLGLVGFMARRARMTV
jgi:hypothetical protein